MYDCTITLSKGIVTSKTSRHKTVKFYTQSEASSIAPTFRSIIFLFVSLHLLICITSKQKVVRNSRALYFNSGALLVLGLTQTCVGVATDGATASVAGEAVAADCEAGKCDSSVNGDLNHRDRKWCGGVCLPRVISGAYLLFE